MNVIQIQQLSDLFRETDSAHHRAFHHTNGDDREWPLWYADYLFPRLKAYISKPLTKSELVYWLIKTGKEHAIADWQTVYALKLLEEYGKEAVR